MASVCSSSSRTLSCGSLVALDIPRRDLRRHFYFVLHRRKFVSPGIERWLALCRDNADTGLSRHPGDARN